jgi:hypothetical protein
MPDSKAAVEQRLKQLGISLPVSHGLFSYPSMYYLTVPGGDAFALKMKRRRCSLLESISSTVLILSSKERIPSAS